MLNYFACGLIIVGCFFIFTGIIGIIRFKDLYIKLHANSVSDSLGIPLTMFGLALLQNSFLSTLKILCILIFLYIISPMSSHIIAKIKYYKE